MTSVGKVVCSPKNNLNVVLFIAYSLSVAAVSVPITLVPVIASEVASFSGVETEASFASKMASYAVLGTSLGKFINGGVGDVFGARRILVIYSALVGVALFLLSLSHSPSHLLLSGTMVEFLFSVQWPCLTIMLASHYCQNNGKSKSEDYDIDEEQIPTGEITQSKGANNTFDNSRYEAGINVVSLASRTGAILSIPYCSHLLGHEDPSWRRLARGGACVSLISSACYYFWSRDSPTKIHDPINPPPILPPGAEPPSFTSPGKNPVLVGRNLHKPPDVFSTLLATCCHIVHTTVIPSLRAVLGSGTFWIVALAHVGGSVIRSSERVIGTYFENTSNGSITKFESGGYSVIMAFGIVVGLVVWGNQFSSMPLNSNMRFEMIRKLYTIAVSMCLVLSLCAIPAVRNSLNPTICWMIQIGACFMLTASLAVQYYHIPAIVSSTFGKNRGIYMSYTDGVSYGISSFLFRVLGRVVQGGKPEGYGWTFCWADVALVIFATGAIMVHFMHIFFFKGKTHEDLDRSFAESLHFPGASVIQERTRDKMANLSNRFRVNHEGQTSGTGLLGLGLNNSRSPANFKSAKTAPNLQLKTVDLMLFDSDSDYETDDENMMNPLDDSALANRNAYSPLNSSFVEMTLNPTSLTNLESEPSRRPDVPVKALLPVKAVQDCSEELKKRVIQLLDHGDNQSCVDCQAPYPRWASIIVSGQDNSGETMLGCFCCPDCAGVHRNLGVHIVFVRSVDHDKWNSREVMAMELGGNAKINTMWEAGLKGRDRDVKGLLRMDSKLRDGFIRDKYQRRLWYDGSKKSALPSMQRDNKVDTRFDLSSPVMPVEAQVAGLEEINFFLEHGLQPPAVSQPIQRNLHEDSDDSDCERMVPMYVSDDDMDRSNISKGVVPKTFKDLTNQDFAVSTKRAPKKHFEV